MTLECTYTFRTACIAHLPHLHQHKGQSTVQCSAEREFMVLCCMQKQSSGINLNSLNLINIPRGRSSGQPCTDSEKAYKKVFLKDVQYLQESYIYIYIYIFYKKHFSFRELVYDHFLTLLDLEGAPCTLDLPVTQTHGRPG